MDKPTNILDLTKREREYSGLLKKKPSRAKQISLAFGTLITAALIWHNCSHNNEPQEDNHNQQEEPNRNRFRYNPNQGPSYALHDLSKQLAPFLKES